MRKGIWLPIKEIPTNELIDYLNELRNKKQPTKRQKQKLKYIAWIVECRNKDWKGLPRSLKYQPTEWSLEEVTPYSYPENIYELSLLYKFALLRDNLGKIRLLHDLLLLKGYIYKPGEFVDNEWRPETIVRAEEKFDEEDFNILHNRGLVE